jgi:hypothetical protein
MDNRVLNHLVELAQAFNGVGLQPLICGGLGTYLLFHDKSPAVRVTSDIDLMIPQSQAMEEARCRAIADVITGQLQYVVRDEAKHFRFVKEPDARLDILAPPIEGVVTQGDRVKLIKTRLHGRLTPEACFIEEDLRSVNLTALISALPLTPALLVNVPSPTNLLILKLFAFEDRDSPLRRNQERAQAHAYDIYLIAQLAERTDYLEGRRFLARHARDEVVRRARTIIDTKFQSLEQPGWQHVLTSSLFASGRSAADRQQTLDAARHRLLRWFAEPDP